jgi:hypothetical protein
VPGAGEGADGSVVGTNCRICPAADCAARREPSVVGTGAGAAHGIALLTVSDSSAIVKEKKFERVPPGRRNGSW